MRKYVKPIAVVNCNVAEGVYAASGDCYTVTTRIHQQPEQGRGDYRIQVDGVHAAKDGHHSGKQVLTLSFGSPVTYVSSNGTLVGGSGTNQISIAYDYHKNGNETIGLGDVVVQADPGLSITGATLSCNYDCGQH